MLSMIQKLICLLLDQKKYDEWDESILEDIHNKANKDKEGR